MTASFRQPILCRSLASALFFAALTAIGGAAESPERLPRDNLLVYRNESGEAAPVRSREDWSLRRAEIAAGMATIMGKLPGDEKRCPLDVRIEEEVDCGSYVRRYITYASEPGGRVPAYLLVPKKLLAGQVRAPAVLCLTGSDNVHGHALLVGLGDRPNRQYAAELAERGVTTLAPAYPLRAKYQPDLQSLGWQSGTLKGVWDNIRGIDLLASLPYVDADAIGALGHSLGGHNAVFTAVLEERLKAVVSNCGLDSFLDYMGGDERVWQAGQGWTQTLYMPRLAEYRARLSEIPFDFHELVGALAPRHVLILAPTRDHNFRPDSVDRIGASAAAIYELLGVPERLVVEHPDCDHDFPKDVRIRAYEFLERSLATEKK